MTKLARWVLPGVALALLLAACGGGSGGGGGGIESPPVIPPAPAPISVNVAAAWHDYISAPHSWSMPGKGADAHAYELSVAMQPGASARFPLTGASGKTSAQSLRFSTDGVTTASSDGTLYLNGDTLLGVATSNGACSAPRAAMAALPASSRVGTTGAMFVLNGYDGCTSAGQHLGATTFSWSIESDAALTMFCLVSRSEDASGAYSGTEVDCIEALVTGTLGTRAKFTLNRPDGASITGKNY
ncbi:MAG: hypothetical protein QFF03_25240 [Pseudomonadota bacterium]|nr:hypothetical protein [Pseudomonadota bacterium]